MSFHKTHTISFNDVTVDLYQQLSSAPSSVGKLPLQYSDERVTYTFDSFGVSPLSASYRLRLIDNTPTDFFAILSGAEPQSVMLEIIDDGDSIFKGFLNPTYLDRVYDTIGMVDVVVGDFFTGLSSMGNANVSPEFINRFLDFAGTNQNTFIPYDRLFQALSIRAERRTSKISYAFPWSCDTWRNEITGGAPTWPMLVDMAFRYTLYHAYNTDEDEFADIGNTFNQIYTSICRYFLLRIGWSFKRNAFCVYEIFSGIDSANIDTIEVESDTPGSLGSFPRIQNTTAVSVAKQAITDADIIKPRDPVKSFEAPLATVSHKALEWRFTDAIYPQVFTLENDKPNGIYQRGYSNVVPFSNDSTVALIPDQQSSVQVVYEDPPGIALTALSAIEHPLIPSEQFPIQVLLSGLIGGWRLEKMERFKLRVSLKIDPMIPITFNGKTFVVLESSYSIIDKFSDIEIIQVDYTFDD